MRSVSHPSLPSMMGVGEGQVNPNQIPEETPLVPVSFMLWLAHLARSFPSSSEEPMLTHRFRNSDSKHGEFGSHGETSFSLLPVQGGI
jgi:hypothetical protein